MLYLASDHRGFPLKEELKKYFAQKKIHFEDLGNIILDPLDDAVDYVSLVGQKIQDDPQSQGIVLCGSGVAVSVAANKFRNVRCGLGFLPDQVHFAKLHDNINILALPANYLSVLQSVDLVNAFLETKATSEIKYRRRILKIKKIEQQW